MAKTFREAFEFMTPAWQGRDQEDDEGGAVLYSLTTMVDGSIERARLGLECRFPTMAGASALLLIGQDRGIPRGRAETDEHYAQRLVAWRYPRGHRVRGGAWALLEQIWEYFGGGFALYSVQMNLRRFLRDAAGAETSDMIGAWNWDGVPASEWARFWIVIDGSDLVTPTPAWGDPALYGGQHGDSSYALGHDGVSADDVNTIRQLLINDHPWKPAGTRAMWAVISFDGSTPVPDGTWGPWAKDDGTGNYVATRPSTFRYWALSPSALNYSGDPTAFPLSADNGVAGGTYAGDDTSFPTTSTLVSGGAYGGNPDNFPTSARLVDDGSIP